MNDVRNYIISVLLFWPFMIIQFLYLLTHPKRMIEFFLLSLRWCLAGISARIAPNVTNRSSCSVIYEIAESFGYRHYIGLFYDGTIRRQL